jgi:pimeloyl-ACP methyl ester carboxylesterase
MGARAALSRLGRHTRRVSQPLMAPKSELLLEGFGRVAYYTNAHQRAPTRERSLLLLHGMHMRAGAHELTHLFEAFRGRRHVYAPDLPGFGASEGAQAPRDAEVYVDAIKQLIELCASDALAPVDVVAVGLTCEHAARAVAALPDMVHSFAMIAPTGFALERDESTLERLARTGGGLLPVNVLKRLGLTSALSTGFAAVLSGSAFPKGSPQAAYTRVHCPTLVLHPSDRRRYSTLARFVRWREHYSERELTSMNLLDRAVARQMESALSQLFAHDAEAPADELQLSAG